MWGRVQAAGMNELPQFILLRFLLVFWRTFPLLIFGLFEQSCYCSTSWLCVGTVGFTLGGCSGRKNKQQQQKSHASPWNEGKLSSRAVRVESLTYMGPSASAQERAIRHPAISLHVAPWLEAPWGVRGPHGAHLARDTTPSSRSTSGVWWSRLPPSSTCSVGTEGMQPTATHVGASTLGLRMLKVPFG